jgi:hypothetical protein
MTEGSVLVFGEIHTGLLQNSVALRPSACTEVLAVLRDEQVRRFERPIAHAVSPDALVGVDCALATAGGRARGVGTVACRTSITGGHLLQGSATVRLAPSTAQRRLPWSYYLARPGQVETIGKTDIGDVARRFLRPDGYRTERPALDISAISTRAVDAVQASPALDRRPPFRSSRTRLRWAALVSDAATDDTIRFRMEDTALRTAQLSCTWRQIPSVVAFCEDLALHDWLLTTLLRMLERSRIGQGSGTGAVRALRPAVDHLLHLWMPAARGDEVCAALWASLERRPGLSRQWQASVDRVRDQMSLSTIGLLEAALNGTVR